MSAGLKIFTQRAENGEPILDESNGEVLMYTQSGVSVALGNRDAEAPGTLFITSQQVIWLSDEDVSKSYAVDFVSISLHAVCRDLEAYPSPCIYAQIDNGDDDTEDEDETEPQTSHWYSGISQIKEMRLVPADPNLLDTLFEVFCECAELNPEPMEGDDEEEHNWIFSADQLDTNALSNDDDNGDHDLIHVNPIGYSNGDHNLAHDVLQLQINDQRFEDAEEMEDDRDNTHQ